MPLCNECRKLEINDSARDGIEQHGLNVTNIWGYSGGSEPWAFGMNYCLDDELPGLPKLTLSADEQGCEGCRFFIDSISRATNQYHLEGPTRIAIGAV